jgi:uncharacterized protein YgiM (DUF1202 family)
VAIHASESGIISFCGFRPIGVKSPKEFTISQEENMRQAALLAIALATSALLAGGASAASFATPNMPQTFSVQSVADQQMQIGKTYAHLRVKPTTHSTKLATLKQGTKVDVIEMVGNGKWAHVKVDGKEGYISASLLK